MASSDESAALKRNVVHQTRLKLALKQLDRDRNVRLREIDKDAQVFLQRIGGSKKRVSLPNLRSSSHARVASAPARPKRATSGTNKDSFPHQELTEPFSTSHHDIKDTAQPSDRSIGTRYADTFRPPIERHVQQVQGTPRATNPRKEVKFILPPDEDKHDENNDRKASPILCQGVSLMKVQNAAQTGLHRRHSASNSRFL